MKIILLMVAAFVLVAGFASALTVQSDTSNEYFDGTNWNAAVAAYVHPLYTQYISIPATWIWKSYWYNFTGPSKVEFRKVFSTDRECDSYKATINITADNQYVFSVNGNLVGSDGDWFHPEAYDISQYIQPGENIFSFNVTNVALDYPGTSNWGDQNSNPAALIYSANIECSNQVPEFGTIAALIALAGAVAAFIIIRK